MTELRSVTCHMGSYAPP